MPPSKGVDILDGTPLLDIKLAIEAFDAVANSRSGWFSGNDNLGRCALSHSRFT